MGIITGYSDDATTTDADKFLTVDSSGTTKLTAASTLEAYLLGQNNIPSTALATNAIKLGKSTVTTSISTTSLTNVQASGLSTAVTIPAGGRSVKITAMLPAIGNSQSGQAIAVQIWSGTVGSGTQLNETVYFSSTNGGTIGQTLIAEHTPSAGAITYNVGYRASANTAAINASATAPAFLLVELI